MNILLFFLICCPFSVLFVRLFCCHVFKFAALVLRFSVFIFKLCFCVLPLCLLFCYGVVFLALRSGFWFYCLPFWFWCCVFGFALGFCCCVFFFFVLCYWLCTCVCLFDFGVVFSAVLSHFWFWYCVFSGALTFLVLLLCLFFGFPLRFLALRLYFAVVCVCGFWVLCFWRSSQVFGFAVLFVLICCHVSEFIAVFLPLSCF